MFSVDGLTWDVPCTIERVAEVSSSSISGMLLDKTYFNDVIGTYMQYTIELAVPLMMRNEYAQIYETLVTPKPWHDFVFPYNNGTIAVTGRVEDVSDVYVRLGDGSTYWKSTKFTIISSNPSKTMTLGEVISIGMPPLPSVAEASEGTIYIYENGAWVPGEEYEVADDISY